MKIVGFSLLLLICMACNQQRKQPEPMAENPALPQTDSSYILPDTVTITEEAMNSVLGNVPPIRTVTAAALVSFAKTLIGTPYKTASTNPADGFDCSGFITHVFNHFNIQVPRSSVDFTNVGKDVALKNAREGDLMLFTGTVNSIRVVGHMGIVTENSDTLKFIHSTSGREYGVTITPFSDHYKKRFVKVVRVFED